MADITITPADVRIVRIVEMLPDGPANEALGAGEVVRLDTTTGFYTPANGTAAGEARPVGIAVTTANYANATISVMKSGILDVGDALDALAYDLPLYNADTDGALGSAAGDATVDNIVGRVVAGWADTAGDKLLLVDL
ncbi:MAG: hypothetical protein ACTS5I_00870 [Rhodanobacter sp.]